MKAKDFRNVILFMANHWTDRTANEIYGDCTGYHFFSKWRRIYDITGSSDIATMRLLYEMDEYYMQVLCDYVERFYGGANHKQRFYPTSEDEEEETGEE